MRKCAAHPISELGIIILHNGDKRCCTFQVYYTEEKSADSCMMCISLISDFRIWALFR